jgi:hypothetical protein
VLLSRREWIEHTQPQSGGSVVLLTRGTLRAGHVAGSTTRHRKVLVLMCRQLEVSGE